MVLPWRLFHSIPIFMAVVLEKIRTAWRVNFRKKVCESHNSKPFIYSVFLKLFRQFHLMKPLYLIFAILLGTSLALLGNLLEALSCEIAYYKRFFLALAFEKIFSFLANTYNCLQKWSPFCKMSFAGLGMQCLMS